ncbi:trichohyalin-like [Trichoplusia ni]|uniref:Trichohyalin-like n=1 Tax=Trichoplusia ni TaxID=7111 RepID=A0A7E5VQK3_TRINI|nr:trichohyalin-like [Trichoplusia ni]
MLSTSNLERLIAEKRREIEKEKTVLGLAVREPVHQHENANAGTQTVKKQVNFAQTQPQPLREHHAYTENQEEKELQELYREQEERIPPDLERYIRRYIGLPVMLKAGEYSPNNPLVRGERAAGDALLGLGEYERRRNTLRKIRQQQYREYLDQQAKKKQEAKQQAERERREREQKEKEREEREREILQERERYSAERRRSVQHVDNNNCYHNTTVDTGVQVDNFTRPLSVAVQTDETELYRLPPSPTKTQLTLTQAERELSPRSVTGARGWAHAWDNNNEQCQRRRSYGDFDDRSSTLVKKSDLRHTYMPSIFDADAIQLRNMQAEKEAAERRQYYQQELKNQIQEQQRIREERKTREKLLEQAEMRRLEEQLRMLRVAQEREISRQHDITAAIKENTTDYHNKRTELQRDIDAEQQKLLRATSQPIRQQPKRSIHTSVSDNNPSKLPFYYPRIQERTNEIANKKPYSINIPDNSIFSSNYDVDSYLRRNLNFNKDKHYDNDDTDVEVQKSKRVVVEKALVHDRPDERLKLTVNEKVQTPRNPQLNVDTLPIPVLRHSPKNYDGENDDSKMSEAMKKVDDKWKVPAVQKNILKALPNDEGKSVNILTQLGSIRRQLQLEQLKLDRMINKEDV